MWWEKQALTHQSTWQACPSSDLPQPFCPSLLPGVDTQWGQTSTCSSQTWRSRQEMKPTARPCSRDPPQLYINFLFQV